MRRDLRHQRTNKDRDDFTEFERQAWNRVANRYDSAWSTSTRQFIPSLLDSTEILFGNTVLDIGCGPGYVSAAAAERGAVPSGIDFSIEMLTIARKMFPAIDFIQADAHDLPYENASFDRVLANFALLHLSDPGQACSEAFRVLKSGGKFGFTVWAPPALNPYAKIIDDAIEAHANMNVDLPLGPPRYVYADRDDCRTMLERAGFNGDSMAFELRTIECKVPSARYMFDITRTAGVRTAALLARQSPKKLQAIRSVIEQSVRPYADGGGFVVPKAARVIAVSKR
jgi:ubiquinone/menaquinone biosynthesis C-methylase UbiE